MGNATKQIKKVKNKEIINAKKDDTSRFNFILITIAAVVVVAMIIGIVVLVVDGIKDKTAKPGDVVAITSDHYKLSNAEFAYFFYSGYYSEMSSNPYMYMYYGLKTDDSLKNQTYNAGNSNGQSYTWFDVFISNTVDTVSQYMSFYEKAYANGLKLDENDQAEIDETIENIYTGAKEANATTADYIEYLYGTGVTEKDIVKALEFYTLSMKQYKLDYDEQSAAITDEDIETAYNNDKSAYDYIDYRSFAVKAEYDENASEEQINAAKAIAKASAEEIADATNETEFVINVSAYLANTHTEDTQEEITAEAKDTLTQRFKYNTDTDFGKWAFTEGRAAGETNVIEADDTYTAYYIVSAPARIEDNTKNVRHILFKVDDDHTDDVAKASADKVFDLFKANPTEENFEKLADEYNEDSNSLYEEVKMGDMVTEFDSWIFDNERKTGDCDIVKTQYGYHIIYFVSDGMPTWKSEVKSTVLQENFETLVKELSEKYPVNYTLENLYKLSGITAYCKTLKTQETDDTAAN